MGVDADNHHQLNGTGPTSMATRVIKPGHCSHPCCMSADKHLKELSGRRSGFRHKAQSDKRVCGTCRERPWPAPGDRAMRQMYFTTAGVAAPGSPPRSSRVSDALPSPKSAIKALQQQLVNGTPAKEYLDNMLREFEGLQATTAVAAASHTQPTAQRAKTRHGAGKAGSKGKDAMGRGQRAWTGLSDTAVRQIPTYPPIFESKDEAVRAVDQFHADVERAFDSGKTTSIKFELARKVDDPAEVLHRVRTMLGKDKLILVKPIEEKLGHQWTTPAAHHIYALGSGDEKLMGLKIHIPAGPGRSKAAWVAVQVRLRREDEGPKTVTIQGCRSALVDYSRAFCIALGSIAGIASMEEHAIAADDWEQFGY